MNSNGSVIADSAQTDKRARTGIEGLDDILNGGLPDGHLYLLEGDPGTGKTTIALQFLLEGVKRGEKALYVTLSESKYELLGVARSHGWSMEGVPIFEMAPQSEEIHPEAQYTVFHPSEVELADTTSSVLKQVDEIRPRRVVFDSLSELRMLARDPLRYRRQILGLKKYFSGRNSTVLLLDDRTSETADLQLQSIAHGVIMLQSLERDFGIKRRRLEIRKLRGSRFREGFHDYSIQHGGVVVYPRLIASEHNHDSKPTVVPSGLKELDALLGGGIDTGTSTLLMGPAGCGKSTIAARYVLSAAERGDTAAIFAFDENLETLLNRAAGLNMDLRRHIKSGKVCVQQVDPAELSPGEFVHRVRAQVENNKCKVVVIDSLNGFMNSMPGETFLNMQMHELLSFLNQQGIATLVTLAQHGFIGSNMNTPVDVSYLADTVLLFRYFEAAGEIKQAISVVKKRSGRHERTIRELVFGNGEVRIGGPLQEFEGVLTGVPKFLGKRGALAS
ncbi:MAG: putative circadian clock protein KaiC [Candidatus Angelobacter sp.]|jgi:circadian clock protein KaiC|nr:putative circadian clock protein KaiC [Candidatus Angelobacter sp.]